MATSNNGNNPIVTHEKKCHKETWKPNIRNTIEFFSKAVFGTLKKYIFIKIGSLESSGKMIKELPWLLNT